MSKKMLKRSLALGALMAFVITGSAMAAEVVTVKPEMPHGYYPNWNIPEDIDVLGKNGLQSDSVLSRDYALEPDENVSAEEKGYNYNPAPEYPDTYVFALNGKKLIVPGAIKVYGNDLFDINGTGSELKITGTGTGDGTSDGHALFGGGTVNIGTLTIDKGCLYVDNKQEMTVTTTTVNISNNKRAMNSQGGNITVITDNLILKNLTKYVFRTAHEGVINVNTNFISITSENQCKSVAGYNSSINLVAKKGIIDSDFEAGSASEGKGEISLDLGTGITMTGKITTDDASQSESNITLNGATWNVTGNSNITTLAGNGGIIAIKDGVAYVTVTNDNATNLTVQKAGATADEYTAETAQVALSELNNVVKSTTGDAVADVVAIAEGNIVGAYVLDENGKAVEAVNTTNQAIGEAAVAMKSHWRAHMNDMNKRMGELRMANGETGVWTRMVRGETEYQGAKAQYNQYQLGYDEKLSTDKRWTVGAAVTFAEGEGSFGKGTTEDDSTAFAIYGSKLNNDGTFVDLIARYARMESDVTSYTGQAADYSTNGYSVSAEFGKRIQQGKGLWIEPQVELTYGSVDSAEYVLDGKNVQVGDMDSIIGRVGFSLGKDIKQGNVYARASYLYDFDGETETTFGNGTITRTIEEDLGGGWWEVGVGANINLSKATYIYADVEKTFGGEVDTNWQWNLGVRYSF